ncbi:galectin [Plakobranchus ocellatus]|uniref:Galectin n=1 Tax=Plakobranchus ocellatus TaxID=259542 RepID=A0AAV4CEP9_9GAST|nr:galectin [Plakobranchus ocellatus]
MTVTPVPFSLSEGKEIIVSGVNSPGCERFEINLMGGSDYSDGTALHFNPRFEDSQVVRNHFTDAWGEEERDGDFPFTADQPFEIRIAVTESGYKIYVDGTYFCDFNHRLPKDAVKSVYLLNVESADVAFNNTIYPVPFPLSEGIEISVKARVRPNCSRFVENQVVRNHFTGGSWGEEERHGDFPFSLGDSFEVKIAVKDSHFQISINGSHFCDFNHRLPKEDVKFVTVNGGIDSSKVSFLKKNSNISNSNRSSVHSNHNGSGSSSSCRLNNRNNSNKGMNNTQEF